MTQENSPAATMEKPRASYLEVKGNTAQEIVDEVESEIRNAGEGNLTYLEVVEKFLTEVRSRPYDPANAQVNNYRNEVLIKLFECFQKEANIEDMELEVEKRKRELLAISPTVEILFKGNENGNTGKKNFLLTQP